MTRHADIRPVKQAPIRDVEYRVGGRGGRVGSASSWSPNASEQQCFLDNRNADLLVDLPFSLSLYFSSCVTYLQLSQISRQHTS